MMTMNALPDVIYHEILLYIPDVDHISFSMVDKVRCDLLLKRVRRIHINKKADLFFTSQEFRDKINSLIVDPYHQLSITLFNVEVPKDFEAFSFSELAGLDVQQLSELIPYLQKVRRLELSTGFSENDPSQVIGWINSNPSLSLKEFDITFFPRYDFPLIDQVEALSFRSSFTLQDIPLYHITPNLRCVLLDACDALQDVSSLDKIHELHLISCLGISDISCLNYNHKVFIERCDEIDDYSNSFRHTKIIELIIMNKVSLDFSQLLEVKELKINASNTTSFIFPNVISSLRNVDLYGINAPFIIPAGHRIRQLTIFSCAQFTSLLNCDRICSIKLSNLNITTLEGLGSGNKIVEITYCSSIADFSILRTCDRVLIGSCSGLKDLSALRGIKDLTVSSSHLIEDMEGVTSMTVGKIPELPYHFPRSVKRLNLSLLSIKVSEFSFFLVNLPTNIDEIKISTISVKELEALRAILHDIPQFSFEWYQKDICKTITIYFRRNKN